MAKSTCIKCGNTSFETVEADVAHARYPAWIIQCASCGGVIGIQDYLHISTLLLEQNAALKKIAGKLQIDDLKLTE